MTDQPVAAGEEPIITVRRGALDAEELAALVTVLTATGSAAPPDRVDQSVSGWGAYWRHVNAPIEPGPGSWQAAVRGW